ncbi:ABC transporter ATP-binding protein [Microbacterium istanbulense]|uniref:ATP-binding cassette domain-containing protein n=1 Tax=Microbacterium istanbulense TaxID=3122049 RepID=A0ABU8LIK1_9MICO
MPEGQVLEFTRVTKRFGDVTAVSDLSARVEPGVVTGFLGPNGAGKTTSLRMLLGQIRPTLGTATIGGKAYSELRHPLRTVGSVLEDTVYRPRRTATRHLTIQAKANGIPTSRVDEVLRLVGLQNDAETRIGGFSLGMRQRLSVATALLGDPGALVLDEPANGLDPEGIRWMRMLMRRLADEGRTVLVSSHVLSEIEQVADNVVVLSRGHAEYTGSIEDLVDPTTGSVVVDAEDRSGLAAALSAAGLMYDVLRSGLTVRGADAAQVGAIAASAGIALTTLLQRGPSLEEVFLDLVYGRRSASPRLNEVANPVAHAEHAETTSAPAAAEGGTEAGSDEAADTAAVALGDAALLAGGVATVGGAGVIAAGTAEALGDAPADAPADDAPADDAGAAEASPAEDAADEAIGTGDSAEPSEDAEAPAAADDATADDAGADAADSASHDAADAPEATPTEDAPTTADTTPAPAEGVDLADPATVTLDTVTTEAVAIPVISHDDDIDDVVDDVADDSAQPAWAPVSVGGFDTPRSAYEAAPEGDSAGDPETKAVEPEPEPEPEAVETDEPEPEAAEPAAETGGEGEGETHDDAARTDDSDDGAGVLPLATMAVSLAPEEERVSFTELITGIPASTDAAHAADADADADADEAPAADDNSDEAVVEPGTGTGVAVFSPLLAGQGDEDADGSDDDEEQSDPRLAAMRTSLSAAARSFFEGPAPDYPYAQVDEQESRTWSVASTGVIDTVPQSDAEQTDAEQEHPHDNNADQSSDEHSGDHEHSEHHEHHETRAELRRDHHEHGHHHDHGHHEHDHEHDEHGHHEHGHHEHEHHEHGHHEHEHGHEHHEHEHRD